MTLWARFGDPAWASQAIRGVTEAAGAFPTSQAGASFELKLHELELLLARNSLQSVDMDTPEQASQRRRLRQIGWRLLKDSLEARLPAVSTRASGEPRAPRSMAELAERYSGLTAEVSKQASSVPPEGAAAAERSRSPAREDLQHELRFSPKVATPTGLATGETTVCVGDEGPVLETVEPVSNDRAADDQQQGQADQDEGPRPLIAMVGSEPVTRSEPSVRSSLERAALGGHPEPAPSNPQDKTDRRPQRDARLRSALSDIAKSMVPGLLAFALARAWVAGFASSNSTLFADLGFAMSVILLARVNRGETRLGQLLGFHLPKIVRWYVAGGFILLLLAGIVRGLTQPLDEAGIYAGASASIGFAATGALIFAANGQQVRWLTLFGSFGLLTGLNTALIYVGSYLRG